VFLIGLGEELWKKYLPKYLESLGASVAVVGLFGTSEDFLDALYQYPGGWLADHWGRRRAFLAFLVAALSGYLIYLFSPSWPLFFLGLAFAMAWQSMASPGIFATIGDTLPRGRRAMGFTVQSMLKRIPMVVSPLLGGVMIGALGLRAGIRAGLLVTIIFVAITILSFEPFICRLFLGTRPACGVFGTLFTLRSSGCSFPTSQFAPAKEWPIFLLFSTSRTLREWPYRDMES
jgi:MFS family permease